MLKAVKKLGLSLIVVTAAAVTTAGGLSSAIAQPARLVVELVGDQQANLARSVGVTTQSTVSDENAVSASEFDQALVASPLEPGEQVDAIRPAPDTDDEEAQIELAETFSPSETTVPRVSETTAAAAPATTVAPLRQPAPVRESPTTTTTAVRRSTGTPTTSQAPASRPSRTASTTTPPTTVKPATPTASVVASQPDSSASVAAVATSGAVNGAGFSDTPIETALSTAQPGTVFEFAPGSHDLLMVKNASGVVITAANPNDPPRFTSNDYTRGAGIEISASNDISISHIMVRRALWGVRVEGSHGIELDGLDISDIGQEGIRVTEQSSDVTIKNSRIFDTGNRPGTHESGDPYSLFGEGIYLGTGRGDHDAVSDVRIINNHISGTSTEAIDVKVPVVDVVIRDNIITDIRTDTSGAIVVHVENDFSAADAGIVIRNNSISNISTSSPYRDGVAIVLGSSAEVTGNSISSTEHHGIRVEDSGPQGGQIVVEVENNHFSSIGLDPVWQAADKATVRMAGNSGS